MTTTTISAATNTTQHNTTQQQHPPAWTSLSQPFWAPLRWASGVASGGSPGIIGGAHGMAPS
jgi:hypothetical protein